MQDFMLGLSYWPRQAAFQLWQSNDPGAMRDEFAHIATLGFSQIRLCLLWEAFQPGPQRIGSMAFRILEQALDLAQEAGLGVMPVLFPINIAGALMLPGWANGVSLIEELVAGEHAATLPTPYAVPVVCAGSERLNQAPDLFSYQPIIRAQRYLIQELVGYFGMHPAIRAWQLGEGLEYIHPPSSAQAVQHWYSTMADAIRAQQPQAQVLAMISAHALQHSQGPRPDQAMLACDAIAISVAPPEPDGASRRSDYPCFLQHFVSGLAQRHAMVSDLGIPSSAVKGGEWRSSSNAGRSGLVFFGDSEQQALYLEAALKRLVQAGAPGAWLPAYSDYGPAHWTAPPLNRSISSRSLGLIDISGREKVVAQSVSAFVKASGSGAGTQSQHTATPTDVDPERYWRNPAEEFAHLWREWVRGEE